jgi:hypothetical protein
MPVWANNSPFRPYYLNCGMNNDVITSHHVFFCFFFVEPWYQNCINVITKHVKRGRSVLHGLAIARLSTTCTAMVGSVAHSVSVRVTLRPTVGRSVSQSVRPSWCRAFSRARDQILLLFDSYGLLDVGCDLSDERTGLSFVRI